MSETAIRVENIGKLYRLGATERYSTLRDSIMRALAAPSRLWERFSDRKSAPNPEEWFWALSNVSFEVKRGELLGIIGRNGAGKSTLLKILSRITTPTKGHAEITGRVGSLLEVGTGFHPELTGRENIFLNGAILGMRRNEIARKFDEIVEFSGVEKFLDTPVKHYSSGMYMRLAFAVAAHIDTEILLVDEVLAVGDAEFQKKCLGKMGEVTKSGRTVLFVSHSMAAIQRLCNRVILLSGGSIELDGAVDLAVEKYLHHNRSTQVYMATPNPAKPTITYASVRWDRRAQCLVSQLGFESPFPLRPPIIGFTIFDSAGVPVFGTNTRFESNDNLPESMQRGIIEARTSADALRSGTYNVSFWLADLYEDYCEVANAVNVTIEGSLPNGPQPPRSVIGSVRFRTSYSYSDDELAISPGCAERSIDI